MLNHASIKSPKFPASYHFQIVPCLANLAVNLDLILALLILENASILCPYVLFIKLFLKNNYLFIEDGGLSQEAPPKRFVPPYHSVLLEPRSPDRSLISRSPKETKIEIKLEAQTKEMLAKLAEAAMGQSKIIGRSQIIAMIRTTTKFWQKHKENRSQ